MVRLGWSMDPNSLEGRVEFYYGGEWGTLCDDDFGPEEGRVICRELGFEFDVDRGAQTYGSAFWGRVRDSSC